MLSPLKHITLHSWSSEYGEMKRQDLQKSVIEEYISLSQAKLSKTTHYNRINRELRQSGLFLSTTHYMWPALLNWLFGATSPVCHDCTQNPLPSPVLNNLKHSTISLKKESAFRIDNTNTIKNREWSRELYTKKKDQKEKGQDGMTRFGLCKSVEGG